MSLRNLIVRTAVALCMACAITPSIAKNTDPQWLDFFAAQGCVIGPATRTQAIAAGHEADDIDAFAKKMRADGHAKQQGAWLQLSADICKIEPPRITGELKLTDPDVAAHFSDREAYADEGEPGCSLDGGALLNALEKSRNWSPDKANLEYIRLLAASLISGDLTFYSDDPLRTPMGFTMMTGACAEIPLKSEIARNHALMIEHFDGLVRAKAAGTVCESGSPPFVVQLRDAADELSDGEINNAWMGLEIFIISAGAGWYQGMNATGRGTPRPPICHYE